MPDLLAPFYNAFTNLGKKNETSLQPGASSIFLYLGFLNSFATGVFFFNFAAYANLLYLSRASTFTPF